MKGKILLFGILFLFFMCFTTLNSYSSLQDNFEIKHVSSYVDENKIMHVFGELKNIGNKSMTNVTAGVIFLDSEGEIINEYKRSAELRTINPGTTSPFEVLFIDPKTVDEVKDFKLYVNGTETRSQP